MFWWVGFLQLLMYKPYKYVVTTHIWMHWVPEHTCVWIINIQLPVLEDSKNARYIRGFWVNASNLRVLGHIPRTRRILYGLLCCLIFLQRSLYWLFTFTGLYPSIFTDHVIAPDLHNKNRWEPWSSPSPTKAPSRNASNSGTANSSAGPLSFIVKSPGR